VKAFPNAAIGDPRWRCFHEKIVYRLGTYIPVPGIDGAALRTFMDDAAAGIGGILSMFTGGALSRMGIFALGIMPYISASIIVQLLGAMWEPLKNLKKEGEQGRRKLNQYTRYGTVVLATFQAYGLARSLEAGDLVSNPGLYFQAACVITIVGGTMFLMWLGEQITARGIGNGISLIIFVGIRDFRIRIAVAANHDQHVFGRSDRSGDVHDPCLFWSGPTAVSFVLCGDDHLLHVFLHT